GTKAGLESSKKDAETAHAEKHSAKQEMEAVKAEHEAAKEELAKHKAELSEAKAAALDASQVLESIRSQAGSELAETKKTIEELQDVVKMHEATIGLKDEEIEAEKSRANLAETIAQTRQGEVEMAQKLAEKAKAALQSVRQELTAECSAAKAQVEVERNLAIEAEENAEKFRLEAQKARQAEQQAKIAEQEALLKLRKAGGSPTGTESPTASPRGLPEIGDDPQLVELKKQLAAQKEEAEKAKDELEKLRALQEPAKQEEVFPEAVK
ncbi:MFP1, partial [Symbiodinium sp. KB8]